MLDLSIPPALALEKCLCTAEIQQGDSAFLSNGKFTEYKVSLQNGFAFSRGLSGQMRWRASVLQKREGGSQGGTSTEDLIRPHSQVPASLAGRFPWVYAFVSQR